MTKASDFLNPDGGRTLDLEQGTNQSENLVLNLDDVSEDLPEIQPMPPGVYECIIDDVTFGESKASGNPMLSWVFQVVEDPYSNRKLFYHTVLNSPSGLSRLKRLLVRVCPEISLEGFNPSLFADNGEALGLPCRCKVGISTYQNKKRNDVKDVLASGTVENYLDLQ